MIIFVRVRDKLYTLKEKKCKHNERVTRHDQQIAEQAKIISQLRTCTIEVTALK